MKKQLLPWICKAQLKQHDLLYASPVDGEVLKYKIPQNVLNAVNDDSKTITNAIWSEVRLFNIISDNVKEHG